MQYIELNAADIDLSGLTVTQLTRLYAALAAEIRIRGERLRSARSRATAQKGIQLAQSDQTK
jgi:hypothetical protein